MPVSRKYWFAKTALGGAALALLVVALASCGLIPTGPQLVKAGAWWHTSPATQLNKYSRLEVHVEFRSLLPGTTWFTRDTTATPPAEEIEVVTVPGGVRLPVLFNDYPTGGFANGVGLWWDMVVDLSGLPDTDVRVAIRPTPVDSGTLTPDEAELLYFRGTWVR